MPSLGARIRLVIVGSSLHLLPVVLAIPLLQADAGKVFGCELPGLNPAALVTCLPQERDTRGRYATRIRGDGHQVRRRNVAEANREHTLSERDNRTHHG